MRDTIVLSVKAERPCLNFPVFVIRDNSKKIAYLRYDVKNNKLHWEDQDQQVYDFTHFKQWQDLNFRELRKLHENR